MVVEAWRGEKLREKIIEKEENEEKKKEGTYEKEKKMVANERMKE